MQWKGQLCLFVSILFVFMTNFIKKIALNQGIIDYTGTETFFNGKVFKELSTLILIEIAVSAQYVSSPPVVPHTRLDVWQRHMRLGEPI